MPTYREACELIAESKLLVDQDGNHPSAEEIFRYSPSGELSDIPFWYEEARALMGMPSLADWAKDVLGSQGWEGGE